MISYAANPHANFEGSAMAGIGSGEKDGGLQMLAMIRNYGRSSTILTPTLKE